MMPTDSDDKIIATSVFSKNEKYSTSYKYASNGL